MQSYQLLTLPGTLYDGDGNHEPGRRAAGVAVIVPLAVYLSWQGLICNVSDQPLRQAQPCFLQQCLAAQPPVALKDGLAETIRPFVAHQVDKVLVADPPLRVAVCQGQEDLQLVGVQL